MFVEFVLAAGAALAFVAVQSTAGVVGAGDLAGGNFVQRLRVKQ